MKRQCPHCTHRGIDKGRSVDGRRAYRCQSCKAAWTEGMQGRERTYSVQRQGFQFANSGASSNRPISLTAGAEHGEA